MIDGSVSLLLIIFKHPFVYLVFLFKEKLSVSLFLIVKPVSFVNFSVFVIIASIS